MGAIHLLCVCYSYSLLLLLIVVVTVVVFLLGRLEVVWLLLLL